ncbi:hypothetical protein EZ428_15000 [Pedobacter frigiditerrae]|uniref:Uncharacterized protein n=1 Tax=Pedobacter frigiditerrae TaxID=2530452 RepID=A0A4R0MUS0_9SPHI|nr:hypothetical protein [Pedobacter frigiditerrae]TCC90573.1 hypothetical protein EZ428_15000 [Pedobacter frigiditerrae]
MRFFRFVYILVVLITLFSSCNSDNSGKESFSSVDRNSKLDIKLTEFDWDKLDTIDSKINLAFRGKISLVEFGEPGKNYSKYEKLPNKSFILTVNKPKSFTYRNDTDSLSYILFNSYNQFVLSSNDSLIYNKIESLKNKEVTVFGSLFQGLTKHYNRDLAINVIKIEINKGYD